MDVAFYHLQTQPLEKALPVLLEKTRERGWKAVVELGSGERRKAIDDLLWTYSDRTFLAHGLDEEPDGAMHPIVLTLGRGNANAAEVRFLVDGARFGDDLTGYERVAVIFDGEDPMQLAAARRGLEEGEGRRAERRLLAAGRRRPLGESIVTATTCARLLILFPVAVAAAGCSIEVGGMGFVNENTASVRVSNREALLEPDGTCGATANLDPAALRGRPAAIAIGISECDLVRLKGEAPTMFLSARAARASARCRCSTWSRPAASFTCSRTTS